MADSLVVGVKETKEAAIALIDLGAYLVSLAKDGLNFEDALALAKHYQEDADFRAKLQAGIEGYDKIPDELKNLTVAEGIELVGAVGIEVVRTLQAVK